MDIIQFIDQHNGLFLDFLTAIYVIATIFITTSNLKSAKASYAQVKEGQRQYEDQKRLDCLPFLQIESITNPNDCHGVQLELNLAKNMQADTLIYYIRAKNIGNGTAISICYDFKNDNLQDLMVFPFNSIMSGDYYDFSLALIVDKDTQFPIYDKLIFNYYNLLGNAYQQVVEVTISDNKNIDFKNFLPRHRDQSYDLPIDEARNKIKGNLKK